MSRINPNAVLKDVISNIESKLNDVGLMYRIFGRVKDKQSLDKKLSSDQEYGVSKKIQDLIGIRVVSYFNDDIPIVRAITSSIFNEKIENLSIDLPNKESFKATRYNIIYSLNDSLTETLNLGDEKKYIDNTFELQIRTIFSEGWHEVEHDLRYKCLNDWDGFDPYYRLLNGIYASLENNEWAMIKIFDDLAYGHYKSNNLSEMLRQKFRLRFVSDTLSQHFLDILQDQDLAKKFFRVDRRKILIEMNRRGYFYPLTLDNILLFSNMLEIRDERIMLETPKMMIEDFGTDND
ncbi:hypothetical protein SJS46_16225 [Aeromonas caviae]|uniref:hypothetical protein n=1 Tax=Aeromonas caviae TaxID=648 RepID=UPI0029DE325B|nr:hypothetical protein [Aeromonas caviae]MDX7734679.1 hypothetical protein [Aeromonas caviae]